MYMRCHRIQVPRQIVLQGMHYISPMRTVQVDFRLSSSLVISVQGRLPLLYLHFLSIAFVFQKEIGHNGSRCVFCRDYLIVQIFSYSHVHIFEKSPFEVIGHWRNCSVLGP